jgi:hypothetical protein
MAATGKIYIQLVDPTEEGVNNAIKDGYTIHTISTRRNEILKQGNLANVRDQLVFHMVLRKKKEAEI